MSKIFDNIRANLVNIPGWTTNRKIIVFESDDWGSTRIRSKSDLECLEKKGFNFSDNSFYLNDCLESNTDLETLYNTLSEYKDCSGNNPIFTLANNVANPDFDKIISHNYKEYFYEPFINTLQKYPEHEKVFEKHTQAFAEKLCYPVFHGREHVNVLRLMRLLQQNNTSVKTAFLHGTCAPVSGINGEYVPELPAAYDLEFRDDVLHQKDILADGLRLFEEIWGYKSQYFISPNGPVNRILDNVLSENKVKYILAEKLQKEPFGDGKYRYRVHYIGMKNHLNQIYLTRNGAFEPCVVNNNLNINAVENAMLAIERAFRWKKPAILSTHRINYVGFIKSSNRDAGINKLNELLKAILKKWPDAEFMNSVELAGLIH